MKQVPANVRLRQLRELNNYTEEQLAGHLSIDEDNIKNLEAGNRPFSASMVEEICDFFECTKAYLFGNSDVYTPVHHEIKRVSGL